MLRYADVLRMAASKAEDIALERGTPPQHPKLVTLETQAAALRALADLCERAEKIDEIHDSLGRTQQRFMVTVDIAKGYQEPSA